MVFQRLRESGVFRQKTIAGVDRLRAGDLAGRNDRGLGKIAFRRRCRADADAFISHPHMHRVSIDGGMHRDRFDPHLTAGAHHAQRNLAPVGDQDFLEHRVTR